MRAAQCAWLACLLVAGCAGPSSNMRVGGQLGYESLGAQREAARVIESAAAVPPGAVVLGSVDASRCHRYQGDIEPTPEQLLDDLKVAAYSRGADGVAAVEVTKQSGLLRNCWYVISATATIYRKK